MRNAQQNVQVMWIHGHILTFVCLSAIFVSVYMTSPHVLVFPGTFMYLHTIWYANFACFITMESFQNGLCLLDIVKKTNKQIKAPNLICSPMATCSKNQNKISPYLQQLQLHVKTIRPLCGQLIKEQLQQKKEDIYFSRVPCARLLDGLARGRRRPNIT